MIGYIYKIHNNITGQNYIGQTIDINRRKRKHFRTLKENCHDNPKLQASWNKYGEDNFSFEFWEFSIDSIEKLNQLECEYIEKYNGLTEGFNLVPGGGNPPLRQKISDDDIATFLCIQNLLGDGYGKTCEQIFGWSKGTASAAKRKIRYLKGWLIYEQMTEEERLERANDFIVSQHLKDYALQRQLNQGGCKKAYMLTQDDYNFAFCAKELGYKAPVIAKYFGIKECTVYDWFNGRSRKKEYDKYSSLSTEEKNLIVGRVKIAELSGKAKV